MLIQVKPSSSFVRLSDAVPGQESDAPNGGWAAAAERLESVMLPPVGAWFLYEEFIRDIAETLRSCPTASAWTKACRVREQPTPEGKRKNQY